MARLSEIAQHGSNDQIGSRGQVLAKIWGLQKTPDVQVTNQSLTIYSLGGNDGTRQKVLPPARWTRLRSCRINRALPPGLTLANPLTRILRRSDHPCVLPKFDRKTGLDKRRAYIRRFHLPTVSGFCEACQAFHVRVKPPTGPLRAAAPLNNTTLRACTDKWLEIVTLVATGYRDREIGEGWE